jgi:hypothetical protein|tara:strand:+ start:75 stop:1157 length:1083 start_codon:yes stop_codon:yes gene_type:complete
MKKIILILVFLTTPIYFYGQSKSELRKKNSELISENNKLVVNLNQLQDVISALKEKHSVSFGTPEDYAKSIFKLLKNKNKDQASKLLFNLDNSEYFSDKLSLEIKKEAIEDSLSIRDWIQNWNDKNFDSFDKVYYNGINLGINWQNAIFQKSEFTIDYEDDIDTYQINGFKVFFKSSNKDYYYRISSVFIINDKPINWKLRGPYDIQAIKIKKERKEKEAKERKEQKEIELKNKPYTPWGVSIRGSNWNYIDKTFTEFRTKIVNDTDHYVDRVKFQFSIYTGAEYYGGTKSFSKTYDLKYYVPSGFSSGGSERLKLEPGDVQEIQIQELRGFFLGEDVSNQKNWYIKTEIIDVFPKHNEP